MKAEKDPERYALLDAEQLAYKLTGNSLYGQLGSGTFKIRLQALAASVTAYGRKQILFAKAAIDRFYGPERGLKNCSANVMYGDTDSLFVEFNVRNPVTGERLEGREARQATIDMTDEAGHFITKVLAAPHDFEFDKAFDPLLMFSKKRYAGNMYEENADDYVHKYMGIALKRRDNAPIVKTIFGGAMKMLLDKRDVIGAFQFVKDKCLELVDGKVSLGQLTVTKSLRADYADPARIAHKALADRITLRDPGNAPAAGDRIGYVYISAKAGQEASKLQGERIETPQFIKEHQLIPDYRHYIEHQLQNPISQAFGLLLEQIPGFRAEMVRGCPTVTEDLDKYLAFREAKAAELLFSDCLKRFEKSSTRQAITTMFGGNAVIRLNASRNTVHTPSEAMNTSSSSSKPITRSSITKQTTMSSFLLDSKLVEDGEKKRRAAKAAATRAANKKAKEASS
jgi:DNA polymerase elongation subunit (family B)